MNSSPKQLFSFIFLVLFLSGQVVLRGEARLHKNNIEPPKLFVFGDSYVDAGNTVGTVAWKEPYGMTFPGKPAGRFSDGRVFSDFIAKYVGLKSPPVPYELRKKHPENVKYGMNFASGGTGVFDTPIPPNMTVQIDHFQKMIQDKVYNASNLHHSLAYVSVAGNDYVYYLAKHNGSTQDILSFIPEVVNQTKANLFRIHSLGVKKVAVGGLHPVGCVPAVTASSSFQQCNQSLNFFAGIHNLFLEQAVMELNQKVKVNSTFLIVDLYDSFNWVLDHPGTYNIHDPLRPCCAGISQQYSCGSVDKNNEKKYTVCDNPKMAFFWDLAHPTQAGWNAVYNKLITMKALQQLKY